MADLRSHYIVAHMPELGLIIICTKKSNELTVLQSAWPTMHILVWHDAARIVLNLTGSANIHIDIGPSNLHP